MKKISEMTEDEVRDYALQLESDKAVTDQQLADKDTEIATIKGINLDLQKRNRELFLKVEQQGTNPPEEDPNKEGKIEVESLDDFVNKNYKEFIK